MWTEAPPLDLQINKTNIMLVCISHLNMYRNMYMYRRGRLAVMADLFIQQPLSVHMEILRSPHIVKNPFFF